MAEASKPLPVGITKLDVDLTSSDRLMKPFDSLPPLGSVPKDWDIVLLHNLNISLPLQTSLPQAWENECGAVERLIVVSKYKLVDVECEPEAAKYICDVMPKPTMVTFLKWLASQMFVDRKKKLYCEPVIASFKPKQGSFWSMHIVGSAWDNLSILPSRPITIPVTFGMRMPADPAVATRAKLVMDDPSALLKSKLKFVDTVDNSLRLEGKANG